MRYNYQTSTSNYTLLEKFALKNRNNPTDAERILWEFLKGGRMGTHFRRQHVVLDYIPDFICLKHKLIIEIDGGYHLQGEQPQRDKERTIELKEQGYRVIRFSNEQVICDIENVLNIIKSEISTQ